MDRKKLDKIREELDAMRQTQVRAGDVEGLAKKLGRAPVKRGKHPMWENFELVGRPALSIPRHGSRDLSRVVRKVCFGVFEGDIEAWEEQIRRGENNNGSGELK